ncbi:MAG: hypothetical protein EON58_00030 [Alphaproteobacteria bacterium]|nr:MAG: hypothetical protein EON58_00030 [Alphaproteobacteria bacterium]
MTSDASTFLAEWTVCYLAAPPKLPLYQKAKRGHRVMTPGRQLVIGDGLLKFTLPKVPKGVRQVEPAMPAVRALLVKARAAAAEIYVHATKS